MKLFVYTPYRNYSFGSTIIAAHDRDEADKVLNADGKYIVENVGVEFEEILEGITAQGQPRIVYNTSGL